MLSTLLQYQIDTRNQTSTLKTIAAQPAVAQQAAYFQANIGDVASVDQFIGNYKLLSYALDAYGLSDMTNSQALIKKVLESNLSDPNSLVNTLNNPNLKAFAEAFNFSSTGAVASTADVQSTNQSDEMLGLYDDRASTTASTASSATTYYEKNISLVTSVSDLLNNQQLYNYVMTAFGLSEDSADSNAAATKATITQVLESNPNDPASFAAQSGNPKYIALAAAFNFNADGTVASTTSFNADGTLVSTQAAQSTAQMDSTTQAYSNDYNDAAALPGQLATAYYQANIGSVTSVSSLINDPTLYNYVLTAYGIDPSTVSTSTITQVLESDPNDPASFANLNQNHQFQDLAAAFNFTSTGSVADGETAQSASQQQATVGYYQLNTPETVNSLTGATSYSTTSATNYFTANISSVTSVSALLQNSSLYDYALTAAGIDPASVSQATIANVLESPSYAASLDDPRYAALAAAFNFDSDGNVPTGQSAQTAAQTSSMTGSYTSSASDMTADTQYYQDNIGNVTSVSDLVNNPQLYDYLLRTYDISANSSTQSTAEVKATITQVLESDPTDPNSVAAQLGPPYTTMAANFNFASDGTVQSGTTAQTAAQIQTMTTTYAQNANNASAAADTAALNYFQSNIGSITSVGGLINNPTLYNVALTAFGLDPTAESAATISAMLESNVSGVNSTAQASSNQLYSDLASAFNFAANGAVTSAPVAQSATNLNDTIAAYSQNPPSGSNTQAAVTSAATYYQTNISNITTVAQFLADPQLTSFALQAYGLNNPPPSNTVLTKVLESNLSDPTSYANSLGGNYVKFAAAFNFGSNGDVVREPAQQPMSRLGSTGITAAFDRQTLENQAGSQDPGVQMALYFQRAAPSITSAYGILGDKTLLQVVQTVLNIPASSSNQNIDIQEQNISKQLNIADFQNPAKLNAFIDRFAALYDMENPSSSSSASVLNLFGAGSSSGTSSTNSGPLGVLASAAGSASGTTSTSPLSVLSLFGV